MANMTALTPVPKAPKAGLLNSAIKPATALSGWGVGDDELDSGAQVAKTLADGSPLIDQVTQRSNAAFAGRGLLNSSMAVQAGNEAAISKALDIVNPTIDRKVSMLTTDRNAASAMDRQVMQLDASKELATMSEQGQSARQDKAIAANVADSAAGRSFQAGESALGRTQQSTMQSTQNDYDKARAELDRAQQAAMADKSIGAQQALQLAQQTFAGAQSGLDRTQQTSLQAGQQTFAAGQSALGRAAEVAMQQAQQGFATAQSALDRAQQTAMADKSLGAQQALQQAQQNFAAAQSTLERAQQTSQQASQQGFSGAQSALDRTQQTGQQANQQAFSGAQAGLDRAQQTGVQAAQQTFASAQSALDRAQQTSITDKSLGAQQALQAAQQGFQAAQSGLDRAQRGDLQASQQGFTGGQAAADRAQQTSIADKNIEANKAASTTARDFAATQATLIRDSNIAESLQTGYRAASAATYDGYTRDVNAIQTADLEPAAKEAQILNLNEMYTQRQKFVNATYTAMPSWQSQWSQVSIQFGKPP